MALSTTKQQRVITSLVATMCGLISCETSLGQIGSDLRNTTINSNFNGDFELEVQDDRGEIVGRGGMTVDQSDVVQFDSRGAIESNTAGYWKSESNRTMSINLYDDQGNLYALVHVAGLVRWAANGALIEGISGFRELETYDTNGQRVTIIDTALVDEDLILTTESFGSYRIVDFSPSFSARISKLEERNEEDAPTKTDSWFCALTGSLFRACR